MSSTSSPTPALAGQMPTTAFGRNQWSPTILSSIASASSYNGRAASANSGSVSTSGNRERMPQVRKNGVQSMYGTSSATS